MGVNTTLPKISGAVCFYQRFDRVFGLMSAGLADGGQIRLVGLISPVGHQPSGCNNPAITSRVFTMPYVLAAAATMNTLTTSDHSVVSLTLSQTLSSRVSACPRPAEPKAKSSKPPRPANIMSQRCHNPFDNCCLALATCAPRML